MQQHRLGLCGARPNPSPPPAWPNLHLTTPAVLTRSPPHLPVQMYERLAFISALDPFKIGTDGTVGAHHGPAAPDPDVAGGSFNRGGSYLTMLSVSGLEFGVINIVGNFGTVFCDQSYWQARSMPSLQPSPTGRPACHAACHAACSLAAQPNACAACSSTRATTP